MSYEQAIEILRKHNEWRRWDGEPPEIGIAIDTVVALWDVAK